MPANSGESLAFLLKKIRANRSHLSGGTLMARSGIGEDNMGTRSPGLGVFLSAQRWRQGRYRRRAEAHAIGVDATAQ
jgi:hypothetical protein